MSEIANIPAAFAAQSDVLGTALIPMNSRDRSVYGAGTPVTHWFVAFFYDSTLGNCIVCHAVDAAGNGDIQNPDYALDGLRWTPDAQFRSVLFQICSPEGLDELIVG